ncbi:MAG: metallophosphoesterase [Phycisphaerae bacterium]|nr:metallophosphoesterase [Saprospiraceae bacterium]
MKRPPIVTTRDARLSLWTSIAESLLKKKYPDLSISEIRDLPQMQGVYAHVAEAAGKPVTDLSTEEKKQQTMSKEMYDGVSTMQLNVSKDLENIWNLLKELANVATGNQSYSDMLTDYGIRLYSDEDYANWAAVAVNWVVAINAKEWNNDSFWQKVWQDIKDAGTFGAEYVVPWIGQASDTAVQQYLSYRPWHNSGQGQNYSMIPWTLPNNAKVVMLGDWGTSLDDAKQLLKAIWAQESPNAFIHLGDIYYSGTQEECQDNFLSVFTEVASELGKTMVPIFTMPGNHEYYSFGNGFFWLVDHLNSSSSQKQPASYFCVKTADSKWQFLGMDTGQDDNNPIVTAIDSFAPKLMGDRDSDGELAWHVNKLQNFSGNTILLSHHQLFSRNAVIDKKVTPYFSRYLHSYFSPFFNKIAAWFWGHEHSYAIYQDGIYGLAKGRLLGSSSYEEMTSETPYDNNYPLVPYAGFTQPNNSDGYYDHTCAVFNFTRTNPNDSISVNYYSFPSWGQNESMPSGAALTPIYSENIGASTMKSQTWSGNNKISDGNLECKNTPALCTDGTKIYMLYQNPDDVLHFSNFDPALTSVHDQSMGYSTDHSPSIAYAGPSTWYALFSDKSDNSKLSLMICDNGKWGNAQHVKDGNNNTIQVGSGISSVMFDGALYVSFIQNGTDNVRVLKYASGAWTYLTLAAAPAANTNGPGLGVSFDMIFLLYPDKNNNNHIAYLYTDGYGDWYNGGPVCNTVSNSDADMAYPKAYDNISVVTEADGTLTAFYRGKSDSINWLTFNSIQPAVWFGGVSLPRIGSDNEPPLTSESAGAVGLSDGVYLCFRGKSTNDIRWVRRTDS